mgnify:CR=1 FL=1
MIEDLYLTQLRSIDIYDILMFTADAVLSGGIRRAATAIIFDYNDELMMNAKTNFKVSSFKRFEKINDKWEGTVTVKKKKYEKSEKPKTKKRKRIFNEIYFLL